MDKLIKQSKLGSMLFVLVLITLSTIALVIVLLSILIIGLQTMKIILAIVLGAVQLYGFITLRRINKEE